MTDLAPDDDDPTPGIEVDRHGDPIRQGSLMVERQSYERVIEGLKTASDALMHLAKHEATREGVDNRRGLALKLDQCRRACIQHAGIDNPSGASRTEFEATGLPMAWKAARNQLLGGLEQAAGGARQLATCFRIDLWWSTTAKQLEDLEQKIRNPKRSLNFRREASRMDGFAGPQLIVPPGFSRH